MKNTNKKKLPNVEGPVLSIAAVLEEPYVLKCIIEEVAGIRSDSGFRNEQVQTGWQAIETSSLEAYASGYLHCKEKGDEMVMPFDSSFLFTCIKAKNREYDLTWASSLS